MDVIRIVTLPLLAKWGVTEGCSLQIKKRGAEPLVFIANHFDSREEEKSFSIVLLCVNWTLSI